MVRWAAQNRLTADQSPSLYIYLFIELELELERETVRFHLPLAAVLSPRELTLQGRMEVRVECALPLDGCTDVVGQPATIKPSVLGYLLDRIRRDELRIVRWFGDRGRANRNTVWFDDAVLATQVPLLRLGQRLRSELFEHGNTIPFQG